MLNRIFLYLYTWHYERNIYNPKVDATGIASWVLGFSVGVWLAVIDLACSLIFKYNFKSNLSILGISSLSLISSGLFHNYYLDKNRAINLYVKYKSSSNFKSPLKGIFIAIVFMMIPIILLVFFLIFYDKR